MIIYTGALFWVLLLFIMNNNGRISLTEKQAASRFSAFLAMFYLVFFLGMRSAGADTAAYLGSYSRIQPGFGRALRTLFNFQEDETLFEAYGIVVKTLFGSNYTPYLFGIAAFSGFAVAKCLHQYSEGFFTSMLLFILWGTWGWMYNGIRQFVAVSITFMCLPMIEKRQPIRYFIAVLIASRIHTSALMMIPVYFLVNSEPWRAKTLVMVLAAAFAVFFTSPFLGALETVTEGTEYGDILSNTYFSSDDGSNPIRTLVFAVPTALAFMERETIAREAPDHIKICVNMSIMCVCVSAIANVTSGIYIGRLPIYFSVYNLILLPWIFCHTEVGRQKGWVPALMLLYIAYYVYENYLFSHPYYYSEPLGLMIR
ncbi:MAG: EpsG family protein [Clostridia bacterium]|nr:EpsG family protein [Clostridia bacterium]